MRKAGEEADLGGEEIKIFGLVILSLRFLLNIYVKKPNKAFGNESKDPDKNPEERDKFRCSQHVHSSWSQGTRWGQLLKYFKIMTAIN